MEEKNFVFFLALKRNLRNNFNKTIFNLKLNAIKIQEDAHINGARCRNL